MSKSLVLSLFVALVQVLLCAGHICMWAPPQRAGAFQISTPGESACYLKDGPCGGIASGEPLATLKGGQNFHILFQQNLNHFFIQNPGTLQADFASVADPAEGDFVPLGSIADYNAMNEITQTNFTMNVKIPNVDLAHGVLRVRYLSQNPTENDRGTTFYQCADVKVTKSADVAPAETKKEEVKKAAPVGYGIECCAPKQFTLQGYETASWRQNTQKTYYFDAINQLFRVDTNSGNGVTAKDGSFQMYSNFTSGIEYYYNVNTNKCDLYGLNYWSDWCYGSLNNQESTSSIPVGHDIADYWHLAGDANSVFTWANLRTDCTPLSMKRSDTGETTSFYNMQVGAPSASVFQIPQACVRKQAELMSQKLPAAPADHHQLRV